MNIDATLFGEIIIVFAVITGFISYRLAKKKTNTPILATIIGLLLAIIPPLGLIYLAVLVLKNDIPTEKNKLEQ